MKMNWIVALGFACGALAQGASAQDLDHPEVNPEFQRDLYGHWWQAADPGWATMVFYHDYAMSSALLVYDFDGVPTWYFSPRLECTRETSQWLNSDCRGPMYRVTGPWFGDSTYRSDQVRADPVGEWSGVWGPPLFAGVGPDLRRSLFLTYSINSVTVLPNGDKPMSVQVVDPDLPVLWFDTSQSGLWANPNEPGWGVGLFQQGNRLSVTLLVHGRDRQPRWYTGNLKAPDLSLGQDRLFEGELYETRGHPPNVITVENYFFTARTAGSASVLFNTTADGGATLNYTLDGVRVSKTVYRVR